MKMRGARRLMRALACVCLALLFCVSLCACRRGASAPLSAGLQMIEGEPIYDDGVALKTDNFVITPGMMAFFFYDYGAGVLAELEKSVAYRQDARLHDQVYADGLSFYDVIMNYTLERVCTMLIYCEAATADGVTLSDAERQEVQDTLSRLRTEAAATLGLSLEGWLQSSYGPQITERDLQSVLELESLAGRQSLRVADALEGDIAPQTVRDFARENGLTDERSSRNIELLLIPYENGSPKQAAVQAVRTALDAASARSLQELEAYGSFGVQENLTPDNIGLSAIRDWLYAEGREIGDVGYVEAADATYVLLYTGKGLSFGEVTARMQLYDAAFSAWYNGWVEQLHFGYNYDILDRYDID